MKLKDLFDENECRALFGSIADEGASRLPKNAVMTALKSLIMTDGQTEKLGEASVPENVSESVFIQLALTVLKRCGDFLVFTCINILGDVCFSGQHLYHPEPGLL